MEILIAGNVKYWTVDLLRKVCGKNRIVIVGKDCKAMDKKRGITCFPIAVSDEKFETIFMNYSFDRVIYVSESLTWGGAREGEIENLRSILHLCRRVHTSQIVILSSAQVCSDVRNADTVINHAIEELCSYYTEENWLPVKIVRTPFLCSGKCPGDFLYDLFEQMDKEGTVEFLEDPAQKAYFIDMEDLAEFLFRLFDTWEGQSETLNLFGCSERTFGDLGEQLKKINPQVQVIYRKRTPVYRLDLGENLIRERYGWAARIDVIQELQFFYDAYQKISAVDTRPKARWVEKLSRYKKFLIAAELLGGCLLTEYLMEVLGSTVQFRMIDVRLLFIVIMSSIYGMNVGLAAATLEIVSVAYAYAQNGMNWQTLFYEPTNWVPFILYLVVGAICGYIKLKNEDAIHFIKEENKLVREKYHFITTLYQEVLENKNKYKKQIIGSRDSFGKIFEVVKRLDTVLPQRVFAEAIPVLEDVLENHTIAIYSVRDSNAVFGRLEVSSHAMSTLSKSIVLNEYQEAMETLNKGEVWFNQDLLENYPMYIAGVKRDSRIALFIMVFRVEYDQIGMHYANLLRIICGLIEASILKAWEYQIAIRDQSYIEDTMIAKEPYFLEQLSIRHEMAEKRIAGYQLVQILSEGRDLRRMDELLRTKIRENDLVGEGYDGNVYLLLAQLDNNNVEMVMKRLHDLGLNCKVVDRIGDT